MPFVNVLECAKSLLAGFRLFAPVHRRALAQGTA